MTYTLNFDTYELGWEAEKKNDEIKSALISAAYVMRDNARKILKSSPYKMDKVANGIVLGALKKDYYWSYRPQVKLHAFGKESSLARIFVGGTVPRWTGKKNREFLEEVRNEETNRRRKIYNIPKERFTGYIRNSNAIGKAVNQGILDNKINEVLK